MAWQSFNRFLYYFCSLRLDAEPSPPTQIEPVSSPPQNVSEEARGRAKQKKEGTLGRCPPRVLSSSVNLGARSISPIPGDMLLHELYLSVGESGNNSRTQNAAKSLSRPYFMNSKQ